MRPFKHFKAAFLIIGIVSTFIGCTDLDGVNERIDKIEAEVTEIKAAIEALETAYAQGKIISSATEDYENGGGGISFFLMALL